MQTRYTDLIFFVFAITPNESLPMKSDTPKIDNMEDITSSLIPYTEDTAGRNGASVES